MKIIFHIFECTFKVFQDSTAGAGSPYSPVYYAKRTDNPPTQNTVDLSKMNNYFGHILVYCGDFNPSDLQLCVVLIINKMSVNLSQRD